MQLSYGSIKCFFLVCIFFFFSPNQFIHKPPFLQKAELRGLLPKSLLDHGFFPVGIPKHEGNDSCKRDQVCSYSWSGVRKMPSYLNKLVFPEKFMSALRTIAMKEDELYQVSTLLEEVHCLHMCLSLH